MTLAFAFVAEPTSDDVYDGFIIGFDMGRSDRRNAHSRVSDFLRTADSLSMRSLRASLRDPDETHAEHSLRSTPFC